MAPFHTPTPTTTRRTNFDFYPTYKAAAKLVDKARAYSLTEVSAYGAIINIIVDGETHQLTKKKIQWGDIALNLFGICPMKYPKVVKQHKAELQKHALIILV